MLLVIVVEFQLAKIELLIIMALMLPFLILTIKIINIMKLHYMQQKRNTITSNAPMSGSTIGIADLSGMVSVCSTKQDHSHVNPMSAFVSMMMALQVPAQESVGVIAPYHAQAQLLHAMAKDAANFLPEREQIACATVHQFQGSEKDVIIYDATDCYRLAYPGPLLTSRDNNYANRLFNVAMTRAKGKFIAVANAHFMERKLPKHSLMFSEMLHLPRSKASYWAGSDLPQQIFQNGPLTCFSQKSAASAFLHDLKNAHKEIHIDIVGAVTEKLHIPGFTQLLTEATTKKVKVVVRAEKRAALPNELRAIAIENPYIKNSMTIIDKHISWLGAPFSESNFVVEGQVIPTKYYPGFRYEGIYTAKVLSAVSEMNQVIDYGVAEECSSDKKTFAGYIRATKVCPECGKPLQLKKSQKKKGHYFLSCSGYAHLSGDDNMIEAFREGHDIHAATAAKIYKETMDSVTRDQRTKAKRANFGIIYGITVFGLAERLEISRDEAKQLIDGYFHTFLFLRYNKVFVFC